MEQMNAVLAGLQEERRHLQKQAWSKGNYIRLRRERAWRVATIAFCHVPTAGEAIATSLLRGKYGECIGMNIAACTFQIEKRFLEMPVDKLALVLDWTTDTPRGELAEAKRLVEEVRLLSWVTSQNCTQGVSPPPQFVWEKRCFLSIENSSEPDSRASSHRPARSAGARKWVQRFRRRWGLVMGRQPAKDMLTVETMRSKVLCKVFKKCKVF